MMFVISSVVIVLISAIVDQSHGHYYTYETYELYYPPKAQPNQNYQQRPVYQTVKPNYNNQQRPVYQTVKPNYNNQQRPVYQTAKPIYNNQQRPVYQTVHTNYNNNQQRPVYQTVNTNYNSNRQQPVYQQSYQTQQNRPKYNQNQQQNPSVVVTEAEWVCTNQKTNDMMIITADDIPTSKVNNQQGQWQGPYNPQVQPQQPSYQPPTNYPQQSAIPTYTTTTAAPYTTTERGPGPIWVDNINQPTTPVYTTTEKGPGPIWGVVTPTTTKKPIVNWPNNSNNGFTVDQQITNKPNPFFEPTTPKSKQPVQTTTPADEDGIEIVIG